MSVFRKISTKDKEKLISLLKQLTDKEPCLNIDTLTTDPNFLNVVVENEGREIIGFGSLCIYNSAVKGKTGVVEDIIVDENHRGSGLGRKIVENLIFSATKAGAKTITLTSNPRRTAARKLYESLGFKIYETSFFVKEI